MIRNAGLIFIAVLCLQLSGCGSADDRVAKYAQWSVEQQTQQNQKQAQQNEALLEAQRSLHQGIQQERSHLDQQHDEVETQRREVADQRLHEPLIAASIQSTGLLLACLLPLLICAYALRQAGARSTNEELAAMLASELTSDKPALFAAAAPRLPDKDSEPRPE